MYSRKLAPRSMWGLFVLGCMVLVTVLALVLLSRKSGNNLSYEDYPTSKGLVNESIYPKKVVELYDPNSKEEHEVVVIRFDHITAELLESGDVWEICALDKFPLFTNDFAQALLHQGGINKFPEFCATALTDHMLSVNPYTWRLDTYDTFQFFVTDPPLSYQRIFEDPLGTLNEVVGVISRPECLMDRESSKPWALKEACSADAVMLYSEFYSICFTNDHIPMLTGDANSLEDSNASWKTYLSNLWLHEKCQDYIPYSEKYDLIQALGGDEAVKEVFPDIDIEKFYYTKHELIATLIALAARLGDEAAGLTNHAYEIGVFEELLESNNWEELTKKKPPNSVRLQETLDWVESLDARPIQFSWDWLVQQLCAAPKSEDWSEHPSCRELIDELFNEPDVSGRRVDILIEFEQVATKLGVYD